MAVNSVWGVLLFGFESHRQNTHGVMDTLIHLALEKDKAENVQKQEKIALSIILIYNYVLGFARVPFTRMYL